MKIFQRRKAVCLCFNIIQLMFGKFVIRIYVSFKLLENMVIHLIKLKKFPVVYMGVVADIVCGINDNSLCVIQSRRTVGCSGRSSELVTIRMPDVGSERNCKRIVLNFDEINNLRTAAL